MSNKRIGIITYHSALNAGAVLQAFAMQTFLTELGCDVEFIDYHQKPRWNWRRYVAKTPRNLLLKWQRLIRGYIYNQKAVHLRYLKVGKVRYNEYKDLFRNPPTYDVYIAGSDQIWNFLVELSPAFLLDFVPKGKRKVAYAASMGQCRVPSALHARLKESLLSFDYISLREKNGVDFVNNLLDGVKIATQTIDPTLLISRGKYDVIQERISVPEHGYICTYILSLLDEIQKQSILKLASQKSLPIKNLLNPDTCEEIEYADNVVVSPFQWLYAIANAKYVVCSSFHAVVFSLVYQKPFVAIMPLMSLAHGGNQRIVSLLSSLNLLDRCVYANSVDDIINVIDNPVDWFSVSLKIDELRKESISFLQKAIE